MHAIPRVPATVWLCGVVTLMFWTGIAEAVVEASAAPLRAPRVMAVLVVAAAVFLAWLWRPEPGNPDVSS